MTAFAYVTDDDSIVSWNEGDANVLANARDVDSDDDAGAWCSYEEETERFSRQPDPIDAAIERSRFILSLREDWDDAGSAGYSIETWQRAVAFLRGHSDFTHRIFGFGLPAPAISPADTGSIDLYWRTIDKSLLINFPDAAAEPATYFGRLAKGGTISGQIAAGSLRPELVAWLIMPL